jgi:hypothetical protein
MVNRKKSLKINQSAIYRLMAQDASLRKYIGAEIPILINKWI